MLTCPPQQHHDTKVSACLGLLQSTQEFLGSHLVDCQKSSGHEIDCVQEGVAAAQAVDLLE